MTELTTDESVGFLRAQGFGRLAMILSDEPHIVPVNYVHHADDAGPGIVYIRSAPGDKLFAAATNQSVAFQVDRVTDTDAVSVIVRGPARIVESRTEIALVDELSLDPWVTTYKAEIIAIDLREVTGRRFDFTADRQGPPAEPA